MNIILKAEQDNEMKTYYLKVSQKSPSMQEDEVEIQAASYREAVSQCHDKWREVGRRVELHDVPHSTYSWHCVDYLGNAVDRNTNSGVPRSQKIA